MDEQKKKQWEPKCIHFHINKAINNNVLKHRRLMNKILSEVKDCIVEKTIYIGDGIKDIHKTVLRESNETWVAAGILLKIVKGQKVNNEEFIFLRDQTVDIGKALTLIGLQAVPGSSLAIIVIEKAVQKYGFTLFPKEQKRPKTNEANPTSGDVALDGQLERF